MKCQICNKPARNNLCHDCKSINDAYYRGYGLAGTQVENPYNYCSYCGGSGECETELYEGLVTCWNCELNEEMKEAFNDGYNTCLEFILMGSVS